MYPHYLLYDEGCTPCVRFKEGIISWDKGRRIEPMGMRDPRIREIVPQMPRELLFQSFHLVFPDGRVASGHQAIPEILKLLPGLGWIGYSLKFLPGAEKLSERIYAWMAAAKER